MKNKPFSPVEAMQATQDAHDKAYGVFKADETRLNNKHQELIADTKQKLVDSFCLSDCSWDKILTEVIDKVLEEERERWVKAVGEKIDKTTRELMMSSFQEGVDTTKFMYDEALKALDKTPPNKV